MHFETTQTKRFKQNVQCAEWYAQESDNILNDAFRTDAEKLAALDDLENKILTLAAPFLATQNIIKTKMESLK